MVGIIHAPSLVRECTTGCINIKKSGGFVKKNLYRNGPAMMTGEGRLKPIVVILNEA
jgi:hypothetical protein